MKTFTVTAERGTRHWILQCREHPGALSEVTRLSEAETTIREAIAFVAGIQPETFAIDLVPAITPAARQHVQNAKLLRDEAARAKVQAAQEMREAARAMVGEGLPLRDIGTVLGVSFQRVHQLLGEEDRP